MAVTFAVSALVTGVALYSETAPESRVRDYLEALRHDDVNAARSMLSDQGEEVADSRLLTPTALDNDWSIADIQIQRRFNSWEDTQAAVYATIQASNGERDSRWFNLRWSANEWRIADGLVQVELPSTPVPELDINGERVEFPMDQSPDPGRLVLFPGAYRFGADLSHYLRMDDAPRVMLGGVHRVRVDGREVPDEETPPALGLTEAGDEAAQRALDDYIDDCAAESEPLVPGCPFGIERIPMSQNTVYLTGAENEDLEWEIEEYPEITAVEQKSEFHYASRSVGTVRLTGTVEYDNETVEVDRRCPISIENLRFTVDENGDPLIYPMDGYEGRETLSPDSPFWATCDR